MFGYALGRHAADWLEGKSVPQAMDILPIALTRDNIAQYEADQANPAAVYRGCGEARRVPQDVREHLLRHARQRISTFRGRPRRRNRALCLVRGEPRSLTKRNPRGA